MLLILFAVACQAQPIEPYLQTSCDMEFAPITSKGGRFNDQIRTECLHLTFPDPFEQFTQRCSPNSGCTNNCGFDAAFGGEPRQCDSVLVDRRCYCTDHPNGATCWVNEMCASNLCQHGIGVGFGRCTERGGQGFRCTSNHACNPGLGCARANALFGDRICCPAIHFPPGNPTTYCTNMPNGNTCWSNEMCESGLCDCPNTGEGCAHIGICIVNH